MAPSADGWFLLKHVSNGVFHIPVLSYSGISNSSYFLFGEVTAKLFEHK